MARLRTVWSPGALALVPRRFRPIYRIVLPIVDVLSVGFSLAAIAFGSRVVERATSGWYVYFWAVLVGLSAIAALVGLVFLLDWVEILGKLGLCVSLASFIFLLIQAARFGATSTLLTLCITVGFLLFPLFRIFDLIGELARKSEET